MHIISIPQGKMDVSTILKEATCVARFKKEKRSEHTDLATVESQRNDITAEEFPEGPYGSSLNAETLGKSRPWREDQRPPNSYTYEDRRFHEGIPRDYPGSHPLHDADEEGDQNTSG